MTSAISPSSEWQDVLTAKINACAVQRNTSLDGETYGELDTKDSSAPTSYPASDEEDAQRRSSVTLHAPPSDLAGTAAGNGAAKPQPASANREDDDQQARRQRRRVEDSSTAVSHAGSPAATSVSGRSQSPHYPCPPPHPALLSKHSQASLRASHSLSPVAGEEAHEESADEEGESGEDELAIAVGQLSINEDEQVRYHGKASGLHLLGASERDDGRSEGGIW